MPLHAKPLLDSPADASQEAMLTFDKNGHIQGANAAAEALFGLPQHDLLGGRVTLVPAPNRARDLPASDPARLMCGSRAALKTHFQSTAAKASKTGHGQAVMLMLNVDRFKRINDQLGFDAGDATIAHIGERLQRFLQSRAALHEGFLCRLHGDDFVILWSESLASAPVPTWLGELRSALSEPLEIQGQRFVFSVSVGLAQCPWSSAGFDELLSDADMAMRLVKMRGGNGVQVYARSDAAPRLRVRETEHSVILGLERRQFHPFFQPKVCALTGQIVGFEALLRWVHPERGLIPLTEFFPMLQNSSLMIEVGLQLFSQLVETQKMWRAQGCDVPMSFNLSNGELLSQPFRTELLRLLGQAGVPPSCICLEITETVLSDLGDTGEAIIAELRQAGFLLSMDDFGVGTSSLARLSHIPLTEMKVDRSFIIDIDNSDKDFDLLRGIVNLGQSLGLSVVLEGVESEAQMHLAKTLGDLTIQGFYYSKAVDSRQAFDMVRAQPFLVH